MVPLFFCSKPLVISLLFSSERTLLLSNRTWQWKGGWDGWCGSTAATCSCVSGNLDAASLIWYWRYGKPFLFLMLTRFPFFCCVLVEVGYPFMEDGLAGSSPRKVWHNWSKSSKVVGTISMVVGHPPSYEMHIWAEYTSWSDWASFGIMVVRKGSDDVGVCADEHLFTIMTMMFCWQVHVFGAVWENWD